MLNQHVRLMVTFITVLAPTLLPMKTPTLVIGKTAKRTDKAPTLLPMAIHTLVSGAATKRTDKASTL